MKPVDIFWPMFAQVALTAVVWMLMYRRRVAEMRRRRIHPDTVARSREIMETLEDTAAADNFRNLFEMPVLFYVVCLALAVFDQVSALQLALAWAFVSLRVAHSTIQLTSNRVLHRFYAYVVSCWCLLAMWAVLAFTLLRNS